MLHPRSARPWRRPPLRPARSSDRRRRALAGAVATIALLAVAAVIGSGAGGGRGLERADDQFGTGSQGGGSALAADDAAGVEASGASKAGRAPSPTVVAGGGDADLSGAAQAGGGEVQLAGAPAGAKIIRTGSIQVELAEGGFAAGSAGLTRIATGLGGFVSASEISSFEDDPRGTVTLRIPAEAFDQALAEVSELGEVEALTTGSQDVTGEYTDVASRLKALEAEREQIERVLGRAESIPDILAVRDRLAVVQSEVEQHQGRQKVLDDQTSLSTLTVQLSEQGSETAVTEPAPERTGLARLAHDSGDRFTDGGRAIALGLATLAPWLLLALVLWLPARWAWRRLSPVEPTPPAAAAS